jgi:hypothetical protein
VNFNGVRICDYLPAKSQPAQILPGSPQPVLSPSPTPMIFNQTSEDATTIRSGRRPVSERCRIF